jgi:hypothetical protein
MASLVTIAGTELPMPSSYVGLTADLVDSGRNTEGYVVGAVIREDVAKVEMSWRFLTAKQWSDVMKLFNSNYGGTFIQPVTFFNQTSAEFETRDMYVSDRTSSGAFKVDPETGMPLGWQDCKLSLIEK